MKHNEPTIAPAMQNAIDRYRDAIVHGGNVNRDYSNEWNRMRRMSARNNSIAHRSARLAQEASE